MGTLEAIGSALLNVRGTMTQESTILLNFEGQSRAISRNRRDRRSCRKGKSLAGQIAQALVGADEHQDIFGEDGGIGGGHEDRPYASQLACSGGVDLCPGVDDAVFAPDCREAIPTVSAWGLVILALLLFTAGKIYLGSSLSRERRPL